MWLPKRFFRVIHRLKNRPLLLLFLFKNNNRGEVKCHICQKSQRLEVTTMDKDLQEQREKIEMQELFVKEYEKIKGGMEL